jgi:hypothetical protein
LRVDQRHIFGNVVDGQVLQRRYDDLTGVHGCRCGFLAGSQDTGEKQSALRNFGCAECYGLEVRIVDDIARSDNLCLTYK